jgi:alpha-beta hydrolase superfamily lysophospholipase
MLLLFCRALLFWLALLEMLAGRYGWWGLSWLGRRFPRRLLLALPPAFWLGARASRGRVAVSLALAVAPALAVQAIVASLRNRALNPVLRLWPGHHDDRIVEHVRIPMSEGYLPALHLAPREGAAAAVCVLHGSGDHKAAFMWWPADALLERGIAVLLIDMDGHGENPRPQRFPEIVEDVSAAVEWLRERYTRVGAMGISLGGGVAARAVADGADVDALAVLEAPPALSFTRADVRREALALVQPRALQIFRDCTVEHLVGAWSSTPIRAEISTWDLFDALDLLGSLPRIGAPLLLLYGANDAIVKRAQAEQVRRAAPAGSIFRLVPGGSHLTLIIDPAVMWEVGEWFEAELRLEIRD